MATIEALALVTNTGKAHIAESFVTGKSFVVDTYALGANGHDPSDPSLALTPDPSRSGCYCGPGPTGSITVSGGCLVVDSISAVSWASSTCPVFTIQVPDGVATGPVSSLCLLGTYVWSPIPGDPDIGTQFLFGIANFPLKYKLPTDTFVYDVYVQL